MKEWEKNEIKRISQLALVVALLGFSLINIIFTFIFDWEKWAIPLFLVSAFLGMFMHILEQPQGKLRFYLQCGLLMGELYYYCVHMDSLYDCTPVIVIFMMFMAMTRERLLIMLCPIVGYVGMISNLMIAYAQQEFTFDFQMIIRICWHLLLVIIGGMIITEYLEAFLDDEKKTKKVIRRLNEENGRMGKFLSNLSHEIRTPINAIIGLTGLSLEKTEDPELRRNLSNISDAGKRVGYRISDILDFSEIDMKKVVVNEEDFQISSLLTDVTASLAPVQKKEVSIIFDVDYALPTVLHSDVAKLKTILRHLIMNGIKYTKEGCVYVYVSQIIQDYGINLYIEVKDTGEGISEEDQDRVYHRFYQGNGQNNETVGGLGLGLPIALGFVQALNGFLLINDISPKGTKVTVSIPMKVVDSTPCMQIKDPRNISFGAFFRFKKFKHPQAREYYREMLNHLSMGFGTPVHRVRNVEKLKKLIKKENLTHVCVGQEEYLANAQEVEALTEQCIIAVVASEDFFPMPGSRVIVLRKPLYCFSIYKLLQTNKPEHEEEQGKFSLPGVRVLVVDDEPMNLTVASGIFENYGMYVTVASSGHEAVDFCENWDFDVIFLDHMMPEMDGVETMKRIRAQFSYKKKEIPIIALTANALSTAREMFMAEGFDGFVSKPIELPELERVLKRVLPKTMYTYQKNPTEWLDTDEHGGFSLNGSDVIKSISLEPERMDALLGDSEFISLETEDSLENADTGGGMKFEPMKNPKVEEKEEIEKTFAPLFRVGVDVRQGLHYSQEDPEFYKKLLLSAITSAEAKKEKLQTYLEKADTGNYMIEVHSLKSSMKMIGANGLSDMAAELEKAASKGELEVLREKDPLMRTEYERILEAIRKTVQKMGVDVDTADAITSTGRVTLEFSPNKRSYQIMEFEPKK